MYAGSSSLLEPLQKSTVAISYMTYQMTRAEAVPMDNFCYPLVAERLHTEFGVVIIVGAHVAQVYVKVEVVVRMIATDIATLGS